MSFDAALRRLFGDRPPGWLLAFGEDPAGAVDALLRGRFYHGHLNPVDPGQLLNEWARFDWQGTDFLERLDQALAGWVEGTWGTEPARPGPAGAAELALAWCRLCNVVGATPALAGSARALRARFAERKYLGRLSGGPPRDPLGRYLLALAHHQRDRSLQPAWERLCQLQPDSVPYYHGGYGIAGLRGLPAEPEQRRSGFRREVAVGLLKLFRALDERDRTGQLPPGVAESEALAIGRLATAASARLWVWHAVWTAELSQEPGACFRRYVAWLERVVPGLERVLSPLPAFARVAEGKMQLFGKLLAQPLGVAPAGWRGTETAKPVGGEQPGRFQRLSELVATNSYVPTTIQKDSLHLTIPPAERLHLPDTLRPLAAERHLKG